MKTHDNAADEYCRNIKKTFIHNRSLYQYLNTGTGNDYVSLFFRTATHLVIVWLLPGVCGLIFNVPVCTIIQEYAWAVFRNDLSNFIIVSFLDNIQRFSIRFWKPRVFFIRLS